MASCRHRYSARRGFTLIELLLVLAISALLIGLLVPAITGVRRSMATTRCAANLRQIGQALHIYVATNRAWPPQCQMPAPFDATPPYDRMPLLFDLLARELRIDSPVYRCPADGRVWPETIAASPRGVGLSYLYVDWDELKAAHPNGAIASVDVRHWPVVTDFAGGGRNKAGRDYIVNGPHAGGGVNRLHKDGSIDFYKPHL